MSDQAKSPRHTTAAFETVLVDADFAALVLLKRTTQRSTTYFFGSAITDDNGDLNEYFLVSATRETTRDYFLGRHDLHFVFIYADNSTYYTANANAIFGKSIDLTPYLGEVLDDYVPSKGFFSRDHNRKYEFVKQPPSVRQIPIDGQWRMDEFREFYARYSDLYVFQEAVRAVYNQPIDKIPVTYVSAFRDKPFRGGSSYLGFFNDLKSALPYHERPHLAAVQWASPGIIRIKGADALFDSVERQITQFETSYKPAKEAYDALRDFMQIKGWLEITSDDYPVPTVDDVKVLSTFIERLVAWLYVPGGRSFSHVIESNQIIEAKIFLAVFRRLEAVVGFIREGRVSIGD
jgi:hypothetical protein